MWRGRTSATPASRIASSGTRRSRRSIRTTTSRASGSTARPPADRTRSARCSSTGFLQGRRVRVGLPRQPDGQDLVERAVDGMADRPAVRRVVQRRQRQEPEGRPAARSYGEMDTNVDPSSTMQVVNQLIKDDKNFDLLAIPGANHTSRRRVWRSQAVGFLRAAPAGRESAQVDARDESDRHGRGGGRRRMKRIPSGRRGSLREWEAKRADAQAKFRLKAETTETSPRIL